MSGKPTRRQWKGYAVMCLVLALALLVTVLLPSNDEKPTAANHSQMKEAIARYGDSIVAERGAAKEQWHAEYRKPPRSAGTQAWRETRRDTGTAAQQRMQNHDMGGVPYNRPVVDINTADTDGLQQLYGIGPVFAARIVKYRQRLGGFVRKEQLLEVYGMDTLRYQGFADRIELDTSAVVKLQVNSATVDELRRHPYLDYYQARAIVDYRNRVGHLETAEDLLLVNLIDEETARKLQGYIQFN